MQAKRPWAHKSNDRSTAGARLWETVQGCANQFNLRQWEAVELYRLYKGETVGGVGRRPEDIGDGSTELPVYRDEVTQILNFAKDLVDTAVSKLTKEDVKPQLVATEATWETKRRMRLADRFIEGQMQEKQGKHQDHWALHEHALRIALASTRTAAIKYVWDPNRRRCVEELHDTLSMVMDSTASVYDEPTWIAERQSWDPTRLAEMFPEYEDAIWNSARAVRSKDHYFGLEVETDDTAYDRNLELYRVEVVEGWYFSRGKRKGRHILRIQSETLLDEPYEYDDSPFTFVGGVRDLAGQWHQTLTRTVAPAICKVNEILEDIDFQRLFTPPRVRYYDPEEHVKADLQTSTDEVELIPVVGLSKGVKPPMDTIPQAFNQQLLDLINFFISHIYGLTGINQFNTAGQISGDWSGVALRLMKDQLVERFATVQKEFINASVIEAANKILRVTREALQAEANGDGEDTSKAIKSKWKSPSGFLREIDVSVLSVLDDMEYTVTTYPVSGKKNSPEDRVQLFEDLTKAGITSGDAMLSIIKYYDTFGTVGTSDDAQQRNIEEQIDSWLHDDSEDMDKPGWYIGPVRSMNPVAAIVQVNTAYLNALTDRVDQDRLDYFERFIAQAEAFMGEQNKAMSGLEKAGVRPGPATPMVPQALTGQPPAAPPPGVAPPPGGPPQPAPVPAQ